MITAQVRPLIANTDMQIATFAELLLSCINLAADDFIYLLKECAYSF